MPAAELTTTGRVWTAAELRRLPPAERDALLTQAAARAEADYRTDPALTGFEAFGREDVHGTSADAAPG